MTNGRFRLGVGTGEALNEHILGHVWPPASVRMDMLEEAVLIMRRLFSGEEISHYGNHYRVENARLYTVPDEPVQIDISGFGPAATSLAARVGDGFITMMPDEELVTQFRKGGGNAKPVMGGTKVCYGADRDEAVRTVRRLWSNQLLPGEMGQILPSPSHFEQLEPLITEQMVRDNTVCGDDADEHVSALNAFAEAGFDRIYVNQIGPDQRGFFDFYRTRVLPQLQR
jgi:G6PDH family F420-dependent oxidoreductase